MSSFYHRLSLAERRSLREKCKKELVYVMLYRPLWHQRGGDLSPEDVWVEALVVAKELHGTKAFKAQIKAAGVFEDLCERYSHFENDFEGPIARNESSAMHSAMMVALTAFFMLLNEVDKLDENPNRYICKALKDVVREVDGFHEIYEGARREEDAMEFSGRFIEACNIVELFSDFSPVNKEDIKRLHEVMELLVEETKKSTLPTMQEQERLLSRVNDRSEGAIEKELSNLRQSIDCKSNYDDSLEKVKKLTHELQNTIFQQGLTQLFNVVDSRGKPLFTHKVHWTAIFRVAVDLGFTIDNDFAYFTRNVESMHFANYPEKAHVSQDSLRKAYTGVYTHPLNEWTIEKYTSQNVTSNGKAPKGKPFENMLAIAQRFRQILLTLLPDSSQKSE